MAASPGRLSLHLLPECTTRYFWGPLGVLVLGGIALFLFGSFIRRIVQRDRDGRFACLAFALVLGTPAVLLLWSVASSTELILERANARVRVVRYSFGVRVSEKVYEGCLGFVPASGSAFRGPKLLLIHRPDEKGERVAEFPPLLSDRIDSVQRLNEVLTGS